jgi:DNA polymerase-3 subunit delta'
MRFIEIIGQQEIKAKLIQTVLDQRVSHAQMFFGPEGNEKLALAIAYAQFINCEHPSNEEGVIDSCGTCPSCVQFQKLAHPDLHFIYPVATTRRVPSKPKSIDFITEWREFLIQNDYHVSVQEWYEWIGIENKQGIISAADCNDIIHTLSYKSYESEYKVMIIWMVEKLFYAAAPKILKILEEPPEKTLFILISEDPEQVISTIRSRNLLVKIPKIRLEEVKNYLRKNFKLGEKEAGIIARQSGGNLKLAVNRIRQVEEEQFHFNTFRDWMRLCFAKDIIGLVNFSSEISKAGREKQKSLMLYGLKVLQVANTLNFNKEKPAFRNEEESTFVTRIAPFFSPENLPEFTSVLETAIFHIERNANAQLLFMDVSLQVLGLFSTRSSTRS